MHKINVFLKITLIAFLTIFDSIKVLLTLKRKGEKYFHISAKKWANSILKIANIKVIVEGENLIDKNKSYIFAANHSSLLDIPALQSALPVDFRIIYKKELEKIPIFGYGLKQSPYISVQREDPRNAMNSIDNAVQTIKNGASVTIFPEGTRSKDGVMGDFKRGAFLLASRSEKEIVPVSIVGSNALLPSGKFDLRSGTIRVVLSAPISYTINSRADEKALMEQVRNEIAKNL